LELRAERIVPQAFRVGVLDVGQNGGLLRPGIVLLDPLEGLGHQDVLVDRVAERPRVRRRDAGLGRRRREAEDLRALADRKDGFGFRAPLRAVVGEDVVLLDQAARQLDGQRVVALRVLRDHPELPAADPARGIDLLHRDLGGGPALDAVAGPLLRQGDHEPHDDLVAEGVGQRRHRHRRDESTTEEDERSLHRASSLRETSWQTERGDVRPRSAPPSMPAAQAMPPAPAMPAAQAWRAVAHTVVIGLARNHRRTVSVSRPRMPCGRKIITRMTMLPHTSQRQSARNWSAVERYVMTNAPRSGPYSTSMPPSTMYIAMSTPRLKSKLSYWMNTA